MTINEPITEDKFARSAWKDFIMSAMEAESWAEAMLFMESVSMNTSKVKSPDFYILNTKL